MLLIKHTKCNYDSFRVFQIDFRARKDVTQSRIEDCQFYFVLLFIDHEKKASILWISPLGELVASTNKLNINTAAGFQMVDFPNTVKLKPGIWSVIFLDHDSNDLTELEFLIFTKKDVSSFKRKPTQVVGRDNSRIPTYLENIKINKIASNHHSHTAMKAWMKTTYKLSNICQVETGSCHKSDWSSRSPDTKSSIDFQLYLLPNTQICYKKL